MQFFRSICLAFVAAAAGLAQDSSKAEFQRIPPRAAPTDYQTQAKAGDFTIAAEFTGHSLPTPSMILTTEDFVGVEVAIYGPPDSHLRLAVDDFSIRINDKKAPTGAVPPAAVFKSLRDPEWIPENQAPAASKGGKTTIGGGGKNQGAEPGAPPPIIHVPIELERAWSQRVQKAAFAEGDRPLPEAGLIFFPYRGKEKSIASVELIYSGAAGKATLALRP